MSLTISELEAERAKILEEIEHKAQKISGDKKAEPASLKSWLNAAEEVMPSRKQGNKMNMKSHKSAYQSQAFKPPKNKASFFGVLIIVLTLLLTLLGVLYIAYSSLHKELQSVLQLHEQSSAQLEVLQDEMSTLQKSIATGGKVELFVSLEDKLFALEAQVAALKEKISMVEKEGGNHQTAVQKDDAVSSKMQDEVSLLSLPPEDDRLVTESVLDESLKRYTESLEKRIDQKFETILNILANRSPQIQEENAQTVDSISAVTPKNTTLPVIQQPLVQLVKPVESPNLPQVSPPTAPVKQYSSDVKWLLNEPKVHYTLQLASMPDASSLQKIIRKHQLKEARVLPQTRKGSTHYVLVTGSFSDRNQAHALAKQIKSELGIAPWVRKIKDLAARIQ